MLHSLFVGGTIALVISIVVAGFYLSVIPDEDPYYPPPKKKEVFQQSIETTQYGSQYYRVNFLSKAEQIFFTTLQATYADLYHISCKPRMADIVNPVWSGKKDHQWWTAFGKIKSKHADFVLCDKRTMNIVCVIELDDSRHTTPKGKKRNELVNSIYKQAGIPICHIANLFYQPEQIKARITRAINDQMGENMQSPPHC
ncbi:DUF2726 domain-containing protein [Photobacterium indicum]|uniref:DUF2726 domain-containing protein n=1 Tax=Photobacterium indicum TaxID=81447 RepID=UPI003D0E22AE